jgi:hypothetical protein
MPQQMQVVSLIESTMYKMRSPSFIELFAAWQSCGRWAGVLDYCKGYFLMVSSDVPSNLLEIGILLRNFKMKCNQGSFFWPQSLFLSK